MKRLAKRWRVVAVLVACLTLAGAGIATAATTANVGVALSAGTSATVSCPNALTVSQPDADDADLNCAQSAPTANPQTCTDPVTTQSGQWSSWTDPNSGAVVNNDVYNPGGTYSSTQSICSSSSWNLTASFPSDPGQVQAYPDTQWTLDGTTPVSGYSSLWQCFGATAPSNGGYLDFGIDDWVGGTEPDNVNTPGVVEVMVQNKYTYTIPSDARAVTIDGYAMHEFQGGGANEWVYTLDSQPDSGCVNMVDIFDDLAAHPGTSGMTTSLAPGEMFYGIEMEGTSGTENYAVTDATLTPVLANN